MFLRVWLTRIHHWFRQWLGTEDDHACWPIDASLGLNVLSFTEPTREDHYLSGKLWYLQPNSPVSQLFFSPSSEQLSNIYQLISRTTNCRLYSNISQILLLFKVWGYYNKFDSMKSLGVYYWCAEMPWCGCVEHGLEYIMFYVQNDIAHLVACSGPPAGSWRAAWGACICETRSLSWRYHNFPLSQQDIIAIERKICKISHWLRPCRAQSKTVRSQPMRGYVTYVMPLLIGWDLGMYFSHWLTLSMT